MVHDRTRLAAGCEWCGHVHDVRELCTRRPRWSRRGFLQLAGAAALGLAAAPAAALAQPVTRTRTEWLQAVIMQGAVVLPGVVTLECSFDGESWTPLPGSVSKVAIKLWPNLLGEAGT